MCIPRPLWGYISPGAIQSARKVAEFRTASNNARSKGADRGASRNATNDLIGVVGEMCVSVATGYATPWNDKGAAPKQDLANGWDVKSVQHGRKRVLINKRQGDRSKGALVVLIHNWQAYWISPVTHAQFAAWHIFDAGYGAPAYAYDQQRFKRVYGLPVYRGVDVTGEP